MNTWIHHLLQGLETDLLHLSHEDALQHCAHANTRLKKYMHGFAFLDRQEEILYFKVFKPRFMALQLYQEICLRGETVDTSHVPMWFREYYLDGQTKTDARYFSFRTCSKTDFDLDALQSSLWEPCDKLVARLLVEEWLRLKESQNELLTNEKSFAT